MDSKPLTNRAKEVLLNLLEGRPYRSHYSLNQGAWTRPKVKGGAISNLMARLEIGGYLTYRDGWKLTEAGKATAEAYKARLVRLKHPAATS